ncbi:MAG: PP2C family protein-serine/threonine phosphatase [Acidobacteriia bacterium]|nr:PP2C family protein-serine/threonine phosphatase [Terriglobia bacterium]
MSSAPQPAPSRPGLGRRAGAFWQRVSEGRQVDELWSQFSADARSSYDFYSRELDWDELRNASRWKRPFRIAWALFQAMLMKLSAARRVLLLAAMVMLILSGMDFRYGDSSGMRIDFRLLGFAALFVLLALELGDKVTMKRDLEIAREIQNWLLPAAPPEVPGAEIAFAGRPQNTVAGDYYDAFYPAAAGGKLLVVIADVAGKSVPAALLMATFQASLRTIASTGAPLLEIVAQLNSYACAHSLGGMRFTTAVLCQYDPADRTIEYVNAGHNPPLLRRADGRLESLSTGGLPLGILPEAQYESARVALDSGDVTVLYTDGAVEAFNAAGVEFGSERWMAAVRSLPQGSAESMLGFLLRQLDEFTAGTRQSDDITCLVFRSK